MQVVFHIGAHCTGQDRLVRSLLKNREALRKEGVAVPGPGRYRRTVDEAIKILRGAPASPEAQDVLLESVLDDDDAERIVLSNESFICLASRVLEHGELYAKIGKSAWLRNAFPAADVGFAIGLRNMATFLPALYDALGGEMDAQEFLSGADPTRLLWSDVIEGLQDANPESSVLVWCDEDSPILWAEIMREMTGVDVLVPLDGGDDLVRHILSEEGRHALDAALTQDLGDTEAQRRQIVADVLFEHADDAETVQEISLPGWTEDLMDELTQAYEEDVATIERMPGVTFLTP